MSDFDVSWCDADIAILTLRGEHDLSNAQELGDALRRLIRSHGRVIVDLSKAQFVDCAVLHSLWEADRMARERALSLTLHLDTAVIVRRALELTGLLERLCCACSWEDAIELARSARRPGGGGGAGHV